LSCRAEFEHAVDQAVIEIQAGLVDGASAFGDQAGPGEGETIGVKAAIADEVEVFGPTLIVVTGIEAGIAVVDVAGSGGEAVPDRGATAVLLSAFDLIGRSGDAEDEIGTEILAVDGKHAGSSGGD
jgi:hypothetical protein